VIDVTKSEFDKLKIGDCITNRKGEIFQIDMDYVFGPPKQVFGAKLLDAEKYQSIRVSESNFCFFERVFP